MVDEHSPSNCPWLSTQATYEGLPLFLRLSDGLEYGSLQGTYPRLLIVTQHLAKVSTNGLPEPEYNDSLASFDHEIINFFAERKQGTAVLVETFGGRRNYYIYVTPDADIDTVKHIISKRYPEYKLSWVVKEDPSWRLIKHYAKEYFR